MKKPPYKEGEEHIDLGKYAGTYGGYLPDKKKSLWVKFTLWFYRTFK